MQDSSSPSITPHYYACMIDLRRRPVIVCGAGAVATRRLPALLAAGADVTVIAPVASDTIVDAHSAGALKWIERTAQIDDLDGAALCLLALDDPRESTRLRAAAHARGCLVNDASDASDSSMWVPAAVERGDLRVMISTGGSPALTRVVKSMIEQALPPSLTGISALFKRLRPAARQGMSGPQRRRFWRHMVSCFPAGLSWSEQTWRAHAQRWLLDEEVSLTIQDLFGDV